MKRQTKPFIPIFHTIQDFVAVSCLPDRSSSFPPSFPQPATAVRVCRCICRCRRTRKPLGPRGCDEVSGHAGIRHRQRTRNDNEPVIRPTLDAVSSSGLGNRSIRHPLLRHGGVAILGGDEGHGLSSKLSIYPPLHPQLRLLKLHEPLVLLVKPLLLGLLHPPHSLRRSELNLLLFLGLLGLPPVGIAQIVSEKGPVRVDYPPGDQKAGKPMGQSRLSKNTELKATTSSQRSSRRFGQRWYTL
ncbi:hypothetical protein V8F06_014178 [Rhypophila decipiens]